MPVAATMSHGEGIDENGGAGEEGVDRDDEEAIEADAVASTPIQAS